MEKNGKKPEAAPAFLPHSEEAERGALGGMMISPDAAGEISSLLSPEDFFPSPRLHSEIFRAASDLFSEGKDPDPYLVSSLLSSRGLLSKVEGGAAYLADLAFSVPSASNALEYARKVKDFSLLRKVAECGKRIGQIALESEDGQKAASLAQGEALALGEEAGWKEVEKAGDAALRAVSLLKDGEEGPLAFTGFKELDSCLQGFRPGQLIVVAGRPGMGKSALASGFALHAASQGLPVLFFSLEMGNDEVSKRMLSSLGQIKFEKLERGFFEGQEDLERLQEGERALSSLPLFLDDSADVSMLEVRTKARRVKAKEGWLGLVVIDYLQLLSSPRPQENRQQEISGFSRALKVLSKELSCPVVALSQLNRSPEMREGKRPQLSDLRESGSIEQDADVVLLLNRPDAYNPEDRPGEAEVIVAKHRNGKTGSFFLNFQGDFARFSDPSKGGGF